MLVTIQHYYFTGESMIIKEVKEYSTRQRINLKKEDNLKPGEKVVIFSENEYNNFMKDFQELQDNIIKLENENQLLQNQEQNLKEVIENVTTPIYENHKKELENKDKQIKQLNDKLNAMKKICSQFIIELMSLNLMGMLRGKHKKIIGEFNNKIWIDSKDKNIVNADAKQIVEKK